MANENKQKHETGEKFLAINSWVERAERVPSFCLFFCGESWMLGRFGSPACQRLIQGGLRISIENVRSSTLDQTRPDCVYTSQTPNTIHKGRGEKQRPFRRDADKETLVLLEHEKGFLGENLRELCVCAKNPTTMASPSKTSFVPATPRTPDLRYGNAIP